MSDVVGVIDYNAGNIGSIVNMLKKAGARSRMIDSADQIDEVDRLILPGVGSYDHGSRELRDRGFHERLEDQRLGLPPLLGVCLGMQLLLDSSEEGKESGLGLIPGACRRFEPGDTRAKVPHMGWNRVAIDPSAPIADWFEPDSRFYFVHSFMVEPLDPTVIAGRTNYIEPFCSVVSQGSVFGMQFHPEKSHRFGLHVLKKFVSFSC